MKKVLLSLLALSTVALVACGPSKTYSEVEKATSAAIAQLDTVTSAGAVQTVIATWSTAVSDATTANGEVKGEEATKIADLTTSLQTKAASKSDSLTKIMLEQQMVVIEEAVPAAEPTK